MPGEQGVVIRTKRFSCGAGSASRCYISGILQYLYVERQTAKEVFFYEKNVFTIQSFAAGTE